MTARRRDEKKREEERKKTTLRATKAAQWSSFNKINKSETQDSLCTVQPCVHQRIIYLLQRCCARMNETSRFLSFTQSELYFISHTALPVALCCLRYCANQTSGSTSHTRVFTEKLGNSILLTSPLPCTQTSGCLRSLWLVCTLREWLQSGLLTDLLTIPPNWKLTSKYSKQTVQKDKWRYVMCWK